MNKQVQTKTKIYIAATAFVVALIAGAAAWSSYRIRTLEAAVERTKRDAGILEQKAAEKETEAAAYLEKIAYLERQLGEIKHLSRKQDEKLEKLNSDSRRARGDVDRARRERTVPTDTGRLCDKLAQLGHPC